MNKGCKGFIPGCLRKERKRGNLPPPRKPPRARGPNLMLIGSNMEGAFINHARILTFPWQRLSSFCTSIRDPRSPPGLRYCPSCAALSLSRAFIYLSCKHITSFLKGIRRVIRDRVILLWREEYCINCFIRVYPSITKPLYKQWF